MGGEFVVDVAFGGGEGCGGLEGRVGGAGEGAEGGGLEWVGAEEVAEGREGGAEGGHGGGARGEGVGRGGARRED